MDDDAFPLEPAGITRRKLLERSLAAGAVLALPAALSGPAEAALGTKPKQGGSVTIGMSDGGPGEKLNPFQLPSYTEALRTQWTHDELFTRDPGNVVVPRLALAAEPGKTAQEWKVTLRSDVVFHDGKPFTADDVLWSFAFALDPKNKTQQRPQIDAIDPRRSKKLSNTEVLFRLKRPIGDFKGYLVAGGQMFMIPHGTAVFKTIVGTGPFKLASFSPGQRAVLVRNENYWGTVHLDRLKVVPISDPAQRINALLTGQVDAIYFVDFAQARAQQRNRKVKLIASTAGAHMVPFYVETDAPEFADGRVVEALKLSVDREQMVRNVLLGFGSIGDDVAGKGFPSYNDKLPQRRYDPEKARSLLKKAGKEDLRFTLFTSTADSGMLESATAWKEQAKRAGITIDLVKLPADSYFSNNKYLKVPAYQSSWTVSFEDWAPQALFKGANYNETRWNRPKWEAEFRQAQSLIDDAARNAAYKRLQVPVWAHSGYIIWGFQALVNAVSSRIQGARPTPGFNLRPEEWWIA